VVPRSRGGRTCRENIVTCCVGCNKVKADRTPGESGMRPLAWPPKPHFLPSVTVKMDETRIPDEWRGYWSRALEA
jgi:5-methylcytosine-specific restriction endonuclease McrA